MTDVIQARGLVKRYGDVTALDGLDLTVPEGIAVSLTQESIGDYCLTGTHESLDAVLWHVTQNETEPTEGPC